ncbi:DUF5937 family protein [Kitasatospora purpeofusca]|uniref:ArsR/SmtB family transcription factor n=1 Tax=Kitasatospora purpeofusca TaxID=67352 RepID=UPI00367FF7B4
MAQPDPARGAPAVPAPGRPTAGTGGLAAAEGPGRAPPVPAGLPHPQPPAPNPDIDDEFAVLRATPAERVRADLLHAACGRPLHPWLRGALEDPLGTLATVADTLHDYWSLVIAPQWPRIEAVLRADVLHRARRLADGGAAVLFADIDPGLRWQDGTLVLDAFPGSSLDLAVDGRGVAFTPSLFCDHAVTVVDHALPPRVWYPVRGRATVWHTESAATPEALADLLGRTRARILTQLAEPAGTTDLARRLDLSPGTASQHLGVLHRAGLVTRARDGHTVLYLRSRLGDRLSA